MTLSKELRYSRLALQSLRALAAPDLIETQGYLEPDNSKTDIASISPSHTVIYLALEGGNKFCPNS